MPEVAPPLGGGAGCYSVTRSALTVHVHLDRVLASLSAAKPTGLFELRSRRDRITWNTPPVPQSTGQVEAGDSAVELTPAPPQRDPADFVLGNASAVDHQEAQVTTRAAVVESTADLEQASGGGEVGPTSDLAAIVEVGSDRAGCLLALDSASMLQFGDGRLAARARAVGAGRGGGRRDPVEGLKGGRARTIASFLHCDRDWPTAGRHQGDRQEPGTLHRVRPGRCHCHLPSVRRAALADKQPASVTPRRRVAAGRAGSRWR